MGPLIAVTGSLLKEKVAVNVAYLRAIVGAGGVPVVVSPGLTRDEARWLVEHCDGLLLTGGGDVSPDRYGERPHPDITGVSSERDELEFAALDLALGRGAPVLAICRGMQVLNVAMGGSLWQHLLGERPSDIVHRQDAARDVTTHQVSVQAGSQLPHILGETDIMTNSMHHQGLKALGNGVRAVAWADDGLIEGVEMPERSFVIGVQWHPEELVADYGHARRLFEAFIAASRG